MRSTPRFLKTFALVFALTGCGDSTGPSASPEGTHTLRTVNGGALPAVIVQVGSDMVEVTAGQVRVNGDGTASDSYTIRVTEAGQISSFTETDVGTWTLQGNNLRIAWASGITETFARSGDTLTMITEGITFVYRR